MAMSNSTLVGVFNERAQAERAIEQLHNAGIPDDQITYSGSTAGTGSGFAASIKSFFTGTDASTNATSLHSDLTDLGLSREEAQYYTDQYQGGRAIVAVNAGSLSQNAQTILTSNGAFNYNSQQSGLGTQTTGTGYAQTSSTAYDQTVQDPTYTQANTYAQSGTADTVNTGYTTDTANTGYNTTDTAAYADTDEARRLKLREERLNVNKQTVQSGEVGLHKEVIEEQKNIDVPVNREEVWVERRPYGEDRPTDAPIGQDETFRVPVREEQVTTDKQTVETGEVALGKRTVQENQRVTDTVRREEARLDKNGDVRVNDTNITNDQGNY